jgi:hypothetical protein
MGNAWSSRVTSADAAAPAATPATAAADAAAPALPHQHRSREPVTAGIIIVDAVLPAPMMAAQGSLKRASPETSHSNGPPEKKEKKKHERCGRVRREPSRFDPVAAAAAPQWQQNLPPPPPCYTLDGRQVPLDGISVLPGAVLGEGAHGVVKRCVVESSLEELAIKICTPESDEINGNAHTQHSSNVQELELLRSLRGASPFLLAARGGCVGPGELEVRTLLPLMAGGDLHQLLVRGGSAVLVSERSSSRSKRCWAR